ncbi:hypothetical protein CISG_05213 [Coccidioides immitis RMSCC 3703]|uniref:Uncharacterized protein n=1 Tax=Coccidioides immitis RMSCC 3703 TaxID=454286 RepID=A0A0J8QTM6_COCIT|nr:hypothetical protein CISG_05213 [Coccidioides immitis RMSCC 3703]
MPEPYDLRCGSGVVLVDDGVTLFLGIAEGDGAEDRGRGKPRSRCVGEVRGKGVACGGMIEILLDEDGVVSLTIAPFTGVRITWLEDREWSPIVGLVVALSRTVWLGGCSDLAFWLRTACSAAELKAESDVSWWELRDAAFGITRFSSIVFFLEKLGLLIGGARLSPLSDTKLPGPIDFRGRRGATMLVGTGGT